MLHGWGLHSGLWGPLADELAANHRVLLVDLPGHGRSDALPGMDLESMTQAVAKALDELLDVPAVLVGWSLGSLVAQRLAAHAPERFSHIVWLAGTPSFVRRPGWEVGMDPAILQGFADWLMQDYRGTLLRFVSLNGGEGGERKVLQAFRNGLFDHGEPSQQALADGLDILQTTDLREMLKELPQPLLMVQGEHDRLVHPDTLNAVTALRPAEQMRIAHTGHAPFLADPAGIADRIHGFVS